MLDSTFFLQFFFFYFLEQFYFFFNFIFKLYKIVLVLSNVPGYFLLIGSLSTYLSWLD